MIEMLASVLELTLLNPAFCDMPLCVCEVAPTHQWFADEIIPDLGIFS
jgi:hypothetical protein